MEKIMKLKELNKLALSQDFDPQRIARIHSGLWALYSEIPQRHAPKYFQSKSDALAYALTNSEFVCVGVTNQYLFYGFQAFPVLARKAGK